MPRHKLYFALSLGVLALGMVISSALCLGAWFTVRGIRNAPVYQHSDEVQAHQAQAPHTAMVLEGALVPGGSVPLMHSQPMVLLHTQQREMQNGRWATVDKRLDRAEHVTLLGVEVGEAVARLPLTRVRYKPQAGKQELIYQYIAAQAPVSLYLPPGKSPGPGAVIAFGGARHLPVEVARRTLWQLLAVVMATALLYLPLRSRYLATRGHWRWYRKEEEPQGEGR